MNNRLATLCCALAVTLSLGCASGPPYAEVVDRIPPIPVDQGRIFFYRSSALGAAVAPDVRLNDEVVGPSTAKGFFFVDRDPGDFVVACSTEEEHRLSFTLDAAETRYVKLVVQLGFFVGHILPEIVDEEEALEELAKTKYIGAEGTLLGGESELAEVDPEAPAP